MSCDPAEGAGTGASAPDISVVVPAYGRPEALRRLLTALAAQRDVAVEVIVVDDGSPAPLAPTAEPFAAGLDLRVLRQPNAGPAGARNRGAAAARAGVLAFTDDDCSPAPGWAAAMHAAVAGSSAPIMAAGRTENALQGNPYAETSQAIADFIAARAGPDGIIAPSNNIALPRDAFLDLGGFDTRYPLAAGEDRAFCRTWVRAGWPIVAVPGARLAHHHDLDLRRFWRQHSNYGRGAALFHATEGAAPFAPLSRLGFYAALVASPWRSAGLRGVALAAVSQAAVAHGMYRARREKR
ncbi:glycosyltransferase family 2 protein [Citreimonas sp.]|uniref:glycosyltransferase family 2 protein n=1 Tax=Citreimonas sp. TaxID=3036715 RepID=UPI004059BB25